MHSPLRIETLLFVPLLILLASGASPAADNGKNKKAGEANALDRYIQDAMGRANSPAVQASSGSLWTPASRFTALGSDVRAAQVDDLVTIVVAESASAVAQGTTKTQRQSAMNSSITALAGVKSATGALANLVNATGSSSLDGEGTTSRTTSLNTIISARVTHVLPNGYLVVEGHKELGVNSEHQEVTVRGVVRPADLTTSNTVSSTQVAQLEVKVNGKGVVGDAVRRPFILYRILMGLLPF